jgi:putative two-component system response regulator
MTEAGKAAIMVVDDTPQNLALVSELLRDSYRVIIANSGPRAFELIAAGQRPDVILLDVMMPEMDGYEVITRLKSDRSTDNIPVIFVTAKTEIADEKLGLDLGAADYIYKPINPPLLLARLRTHLALKVATDKLRYRAESLEEEVSRRTRELRAIQDVTVLAMSSMAETRDNETGNHILRTQNYVRCIAETLAKQEQYQEQLTPDYIQLLYKSAPLHDIGKVGIPDAILLKPGKLTVEEFEIMKTHTTIGYEAIVRAEQSLGTELDFLVCAKEIALSHQEKWDGSGYPQGLAGKAIPLSARLMAVADVYDALISKRVYKEAFSHETAIDIMTEGRGTHFDPEVFDAFLSVQDEFAAIAARFRDD